jgi:hypothetical protein
VQAGGLAMLLAGTFNFKHVAFIAKNDLTIAPIFFGAAVAWF